VISEKQQNIELRKEVRNYLRMIQFMQGKLARAQRNVRFATTSESAAAKMLSNGLKLVNREFLNVDFNVNSFKKLSRQGGWLRVHQLRKLERQMFSPIRRALSQLLNSVLNFSGYQDSKRKFSRNRSRKAAFCCRTTLEQRRSVED
jgi:hypothetical protein